VNLVVPSSRKNAVDWSGGVQIQFRRYQRKQFRSLVPPFAIQQSTAARLDAAFRLLVRGEMIISDERNRS
jgi:hypothetical protein